MHYYSIQTINQDMKHSKHIILCLIILLGFNRFDLFMKGGEILANKQVYSIHNTLSDMSIQVKLSLIHPQALDKRFSEQVLLIGLSHKNNLYLKFPTLTNDNNSLVYPSMNQSLHLNLLNFNSSSNYMLRVIETDENNDDTNQDLIDFDPNLIKQALDIIQMNHSLDGNQLQQLKSLGFTNQQIDELLIILKVDELISPQNKLPSLSSSLMIVGTLLVFLLSCFFFIIKNKKNKS